jgi:hypothetical protein
VDLGASGAVVSNYGTGTVSYSDTADPFVAEGTIAPSASATLTGMQFFRAAAGAVLNIAEADASLGSLEEVRAQLLAVEGSQASLDAAAVKLTGTQILAGVKTFTSSPVVPTPIVGDTSTKAASMAAVAAEVALDRARINQVARFNVMHPPYGAAGDGTTDDTAAIQAAVDAASTVGRATVVLPAGYAFKFGRITPKDNVTIEAYGATITLLPSSTFGLFSSGSSPVAVSNFHLRGGTFVGTGAETTFQAIFYIVQGTDVSVRDIHATGWKTGPIYFNNCIRARALHNTLINCATDYTGTNAINFVGSTTGGSLPWSDFVTIGNIIEGVGAIGICVVETGNVFSGPTNAIITGNIVKSTGNVCINVEWSTATTGRGSQTIIADNHCTLASTNDVAAIALGVSPSTNNDPLLLSSILIRGNTVESNQRGISVSASNTIIEGNHVKAARFSMLIQGVGSFAVTGDTTNTSTALSNISGGGNVVDGSIVTGTGIPAGTYIVSGQGTTTWVLSQAATATATGVAVTVRSQIRGVICRNNNILSTASPTQPVVYVYGVRNSVIAGNRIVTDAGSTTTTGTGISTQYCGWLDITDNVIEYAAGYGIYFQQGNDFVIARNRILNPSEGGTPNFYGILIGYVSGTLYRVVDNTVIDDRAVHKMTYAVIVSTGASGVVELLRNELRGAVTSPTSGTFRVSKDNITDVSTVPATSAVTAGASPYTYTNSTLYYENHYLAGGTVSLVQHSRTGSSTRTLAAATPCMVRLSPGDSMIVTYSAAPTVWTKVPEVPA